MAFDRQVDWRKHFRANVRITMNTGAVACQQIRTRAKAARAVAGQAMLVDSASLTDWKAQIALCEEAGARVSTCVGNDAALDSARKQVAELKTGQATAAAATTPDANPKKARDKKDTAVATEAAAVPPPAASAFQDDLWIETTKEAVRKSLRDPSSATFQKVKIHRPFPGQSTPVVCGEVNSKNGFGGMSGFNGFIGSGSGESIPVFLEEQMAEGEYQKSLQMLCIDAKP